MSHKILLAEDENILRRNLSFILSSFGYFTTPVRTSPEGIEMLKKKKFDLVVTDLVMPGGRGGGELIEYIFEYQPQIPVIVITAYPSLDNTINAIKKGVFDYFTKPFKTEHFLDSVRRALERSRKTVLIWEKLKPLKVTKQEEKVLRIMIEDGVTQNQEIAGLLKIKASTVKQYLENLYNKFNVNSKASLISAVMKMLQY